MALSIRESSRADVPPIAEADVTVRRRRTWRALRRNPIGLAGSIIVIAVVVIALIGPLLWPVKYSDQAFRRLQPPSLQNPMGTDNLGRTSCHVSSTVLRFTPGRLDRRGRGRRARLSAIGVLAALYGGKLDSFLMRFVDIMFAVPSLVLAILISGRHWPSWTNAMLAIGIVYAPVFARLARSHLALSAQSALRRGGALDRRLAWTGDLPLTSCPISRGR